jgi:hypothetical protein
MPKDDDAIERARRRREASEKASRRSHPAYEYSMPPPADSSWPPPSVHAARGVAGGPSPSIRNPDAHIERHARRLKWIATIVTSLSVVGGVMWAACSRIIDVADDKLNQKIDATCSSAAVVAAVSAVASRVVPLTYRTEELENQAKTNGERWDGLDEWHMETTTKPGRKATPKFGPAAKARGDVLLFKPKGK